MRSSLSLLEPLGEVNSVIGSPVRGAGWYGPNSGLHSVSIKVLNFQGRISVQASLAGLPGTHDWFSVLPDGVDFWQYPRPTSAMTTTTAGETSARGFNFVANVVWVRAVVDRSYLVSTGAAPMQTAYLGTVDSILLNY